MLNSYFSTFLHLLKASLGESLNLLYDLNTYIIVAESINLSAHPGIIDIIGNKFILCFGI